MSSLGMTSSSPVHPFPGALPALSLQTDDLLAPLRGPSAAMAQLWSQVKTVAPHFRALLLTGEAGCGQESVVHLLQILSPFHAGPLLVLGASLAAQRLQNPKRLLQNVAGGVLYLPQVDQLTSEAQGHLLRFMRLNRHHLCSLIVCSTHDLRTLVATHGFSAALAQELGSLRLTVPSLRGRQDDLPLLADLFLRETQPGYLNGLGKYGLGLSFLRKAASLEWPGNLDQLRTVVHYLVENPSNRLPNGEENSPTPFEAADLDIALRQTSRAETFPSAAAAVRMVKLEQVMQEHIRAVLIACQGNKLRAAEILGISRSTLYRMLETTSSAASAMLA